MNLNPEQKERAVQLLEMIVRPGVEFDDDRRVFTALDEASKMFGYYIPKVWLKRRGRPPKNKS
jgi:hypothetical protein